MPHTFRVGLLLWTKPLCKHTQGRTCSELCLLGESEPRQWTFKVSYHCLQNRLSREFPLLGWSPRMKLYKFTSRFWRTWLWFLGMDTVTELLKWEKKEQKGKSKALLSLQAIIFKNIFNRLSAPQLIVHHLEPSSWRFSSHKYSCSQLTTHKTKVPKTYRQPRVTHSHHCGAQCRVWHSAGVWWTFVTWRLWILFCLLLSMTSHFPVLLPRSPGTAH